MNRIMRIRVLAGTIIPLLCLLMLTYGAGAQTTSKSGIDKAVKASEKLEERTRMVNEKSSEITNRAIQTSANAKSTIENVKSVIQIFTPIAGLQLKWKRKADMNPEGEPDQVPATGDSSPGTGTYPENGQEGTAQGSDQAGSSPQAFLEPVTESPFYNADGTANLGNQNNRNFGCYVDIMRGRILDDIDVAGHTAEVDLIYTATDYYGSAPMYALLTPAYVKNDFFANYYFRGPVYKDAKIPVKEWDAVNESEIALTTLSGAQFDRIQDNNQLMAVVTKTPDFKNKFESRTKIAGKVFAIKTEMGNRTAYGLVYIVDHLGTTGENGYLKINIKVTGFDQAGDGQPDPGIYLN